MVLLGAGKGVGGSERMYVDCGLGAIGGGLRMCRAVGLRATVPSLKNGCCERCFFNGLSDRCPYSES